MKMGLRGGENWVGWISGACAVHCLAQPLMALLLPVAAMGERVEGMLLMGLLVVAAALLWSGVRRHGRFGPALPVLAAMALWSAALAGAVEEPAKVVLIAGGGALSFWGLTWSRGLVRPCSCQDREAGRAQQRRAWCAAAGESVAARGRRSGTTGWGQQHLSSRSATQ